ncbi:MAG: glycosyltransferase [Bacillota bacterium]
MTPTIGLAMIVRDEDDNLCSCLDSVKDVVDEIVIVDTGSSDGTVDVARRYTDKVYHYKWNDDFSAARNYAVARTRSEWVLSLDADEELDAKSGDLRGLVNNNSGYEAYFLPLHNLVDQSAGEYSRFWVLRLFRNSAEYRFHGRIHEQVVVSRPEAAGIAEGPVIWHKPACAKGRNRKRGRNLTLLRQAVAADPDNPFLLYYLGVEWLGLGKAERALPCFQKVCAQLTDGYILFRAPAVRFLLSCLRTLERFDEAICVCIEESARYPSYTDLFFEGGVLLEDKGEYEIAVRWFKEALSCGQPPPLFGHTHGTDSFLSLYHLGYCYEKMGRYAEAKSHYEQALAVNTGYVYPVCNLFLLHLTEKGPQGTFDALKAAGHLDQTERAAVIADLFFEAGCARLACACIENQSRVTSSESRVQGDGKGQIHPSDSNTVSSGLMSGGREASAGEGICFPDSRILRLAKFLTYSGRMEEALSLMADIGLAGGGVLGLDMAVDEIVALILKKDYTAAKTKALLLWRQPDGRGTVLALLNLISLCRGNAISLLPEKRWTPVVVQTTVSVIKNCLRYQNEDAGQENDTAVRYTELAAKAINFLVTLSPEACFALVTYLKGKADAARALMLFRYGRAMELYK